MRHTPDSPIALLSVVTHAPTGQRCYVAARSWPANGHGSLYDLRIIGAKEPGKGINSVTAGEISEIGEPELALCGITEVVREKPPLNVTVGGGGIGAGGACRTETAGTVTMIVGEGVTTGYGLAIADRKTALGV